MEQSPIFTECSSLEVPESVYYTASILEITFTEDEEPEIPEK